TPLLSLLLAIARLRLRDGGRHVVEKSGHHPQAILGEDAEIDAGDHRRTALGRQFPGIRPYADFSSHNAWGTDHFCFLYQGDLAALCAELRAKGGLFPSS